MPKLKAALAHSLRARNMPQLVFKHDSLTAKQQELEDIFRRLDEEDEEEAATEIESEEEQEERGGMQVQQQQKGGRQRRPE